MNRRRLSLQAINYVAGKYFRLRTARRAFPRRLADARDILVVKLDGIGDFVLATPFLRELRRGAPAARITLLTRSLVLPLTANCPFVDEAIGMSPGPGPMRFGSMRRWFHLARDVRRQLGGRIFDLAIIPRLHADLHCETLVACLSGAPRRVGYTEHATATKAAANPGSDWLLTDAIAPPAGILPEAEVSLDLLRALGADAVAGPLELHCRTEDATAMQQLLGQEPTSRDRPSLALGVGASNPDRIWPATAFLRLALHFAQNRGWQVFLIGGTGDRPRFPESIEGICNCLGRLTLPQTLALLQQVQVFVGNDSGPVHLAAAAGCRCIVISRDPANFDPAGDNSPRRFQPYGVPHQFVFAEGTPAPGEPSVAAVPYPAVLQATERMAAASGAA